MRTINRMRKATEQKHHIEKQKARGTTNNIKNKVEVNLLESHNNLDIDFQPNQSQSSQHVFSDQSLNNDSVKVFTDERTASPNRESRSMH